MDEPHTWMYEAMAAPETFRKLSQRAWPMAQPPPPPWRMGHTYPQEASRKCGWRYQIVNIHIHGSHVGAVGSASTRLPQSLKQLLHHLLDALPAALSLPKGEPLEGLAEGLQEQVDLGREGLDIPYMAVDDTQPHTQNLHTCWATFDVGPPLPANSAQTSTSSIGVRMLWRREGWLGSCTFWDT